MTPGVPRGPPGGSKNMRKPCRGQQNRTFALFPPRRLPLGARRKKKQGKWTARPTPIFDLGDFGGKKPISSTPWGAKGVQKWPWEAPRGPPGGSKNMLKPCRGHQNRTFALFSPRPLPLGARRQKKQEKWTARGPPTFELCDFGGKKSIGVTP